MAGGIAVLLSGGGRALANLAACIRAGQLPARIACVLASRPCAGLERAREAGVEPQLVPRRDFADADAFSDEVYQRVEAAGAGLVCMAGFLSLLRVPPPWRNRVMNIHPALLPAHGGKGFYGQRVHRAVLAAGDALSGCTVHYVDEHYDHGPIILQRRVAVLPADSVESLAARVFEQECSAYPRAIRWHLQGRLEVAGGRVRLRGAGPPDAP